MARSTKRARNGKTIAGRSRTRGAADGGDRAGNRSADRALPFDAEADRRDEARMLGDLEVFGRLLADQGAE